jgi:hypothetical protein
MSLKMRIIVFIAMACFIVGCRPLSHGPIIEAYKAAACMPVWANRTVQGPHTREWETPITLSNGSKVVVIGYQVPGGRITARYATRELEVANAGDYIYPSDVRLDAQSDHLFVKASGLAAGITHETWLFEYDLLRQRLVERQRVADSALPKECPESH